MTNDPPRVVYIAAPAPQPDIYVRIKAEITAQRCADTLAPIVVGAQVYDLVNSQKALERYPNRQESDWWTRMFTGRSHRNIFGMALGMAVMDAIKFHLTKHSAVLRCGAEINQIQTQVQSITETNK